MICVWQVFGDIQNLTYIADTFISGFSEITTICGSASSNAEMWIKVCNMQFRTVLLTLRSFYPLLITLQSASKHNGDN